MSTVVVLAPVIIASWPAITAAVTAAVGTMGFAMAGREDQQVDTSQSNRTRAEIDVADSEILAMSATGADEIVVHKDGITATFKRDARGTLKVCVEGGGLSGQSHVGVGSLE